MLPWMPFGFNVISEAILAVIMMAGMYGASIVKMAGTLKVYKEMCVYVLCVLMVAPSSGEQFGSRLLSLLTVI